MIELLVKVGFHEVVEAKDYNEAVEVFTREKPNICFVDMILPGKSGVELTKTLIGEGTKAQHLSYLGDATVGPGVNVGAGTITCNYDGTKKSPTRIEAGAFVGSDTTLVAPVTVGEGSYIAAGSTITEDVPKDALALGRARQVTKPGWAARRRERLGTAKDRG